jgi:hypothetical protein
MYKNLHDKTEHGNKYFEGRLSSALKQYPGVVFYLLEWKSMPTRIISYK